MYKGVSWEGYGLHSDLSVGDLVQHPYSKGTHKVLIVGDDNIVTTNEVITCSDGTKEFNTFIMKFNDDGKTVYNRCVRKV